MKKTYQKNIPPFHARLPSSPLAEASKITMVQQSRQKWQCKPVCKLYAKPTTNTTGRKCRNFSLVKVLVNDYGMSIDEAMKKAAEL